MDVLVLIDKLDDLVHNARPVPLTDQVRVDREEIYDLLDQMRATIPEEIKQARWIVKERQEMLAEAKREAERVVREAREQQARLISDEEVTKQAERAADEIVEDARDPRARDPPRSRGLRRRDPQHARGQPAEVPRRRAARPRPARRARRGAAAGRAGTAAVAFAGAVLAPAQACQAAKPPQVIPVWRAVPTPALSNRLADYKPFAGGHNPRQAFTAVPALCLSTLAIRCSFQTSRGGAEWASGGFRSRSWGRCRGRPWTGRSRRSRPAMPRRRSGSARR